MLTRITLAASLAVATLLTATQDLAAQNNRRAIDVGIGPIWIEIGNPAPDWRPGRPDWRPDRPDRPGPDRPGRPGRPGRPPRTEPKLTYVVTEYNPVTGGVYITRTFNNRSDAYAYRDSVARVHWVKWRFVGINEPLRSRRFRSSALAQRFIDTDGPSRSGAAGFALLTGETRVVPARVTISTRSAPR